MAKRDIHVLYEPRPSVRITSRYGKGGNALFHRICRDVLEQTRTNIRTNLDGRWEPIQWEYQNGKGPGMLALQGTEDQWELEFTGPRTAVIRPREDVAHIWRGHVHGMAIYAKSPKKKMPIPFVPKTTYLDFVQLPERDPRCTADQIRRIIKGA